MDLSSKDVGGVPNSVASVTGNKIYAEGTTGAAPIAYNLMPFIGVVYNY